MNPKVESRFYKNIRHGENGCWQWAGFTNGRYGNFKAFGKRFRAHRFMWLLAHGEHPIACVCHTCDNPLCVNPNHLWLGTHVENMADKKSKGRAPSTTKPKDRCRFGHAMSGENLHVGISGRRVCKTCRRRRDVNRLHREKEARKSAALAAAFDAKEAK